MHRSGQRSANGTSGYNKNTDSKMLNQPVPQSLSPSYSAATEQNPNRSYSDQHAEPSTESIFSHLVDPPAVYRAIPFWSWNDRLDPQEIRRQVREMKQAGLGGFIMHARAGLETPYMGEEWMECIAAGIEEGQQLGMQVWCYDENGWPSGFADGVVPELGLDYQQKWLRMEKVDHTPAHSLDQQSATAAHQAADTESEGHNKLDNENQQQPAAAEDDGRTIAWYRYEDGRYIQISHEQQNRAELRLYYEVNPYYIDTLNAHVVGAFIESTYEKYADRFAAHFGQSVYGIFTDEPQYGRNQIPWSFTLEEQFRETYDEELLGILPLLFLEKEGYESARYHFWELVTRLFSQSFMKQIGEWCEEHQLRLTGHVVCEDHLTAQTGSVGDAMASYAFMQTPGIDWLGRFISDPLTPKQASSVARQLGQKFVLSETFGCSGWNVSFADLKWIAEWQYVHGINLMCQHLEGYSLRGIRKRDYPPSLYYQQPWWEEYSRFNDYFGRLSMLLSESRQHADILLLHPIRSSWIAYNNRTSEEGEQIHQDFVQISEWLGAMQYSHDYGSESIIADHGQIQGEQFVIGQAAYRFVILPPMITIAAHTLELLQEWINQGGQVIALGTLPTMVNGQHDGRLAELESSISCLPLNRESLITYLDQHLQPDIIIRDLVPASDHSSARLQPSLIPVAPEEIPIRSQVSTLGEYTLYYLVNTDRTGSYNTEMILSGSGDWQQINLENGQITPLADHFEYQSVQTNEEETFRSGESIVVRLSFAPAQSYMLRHYAGHMEGTEHPALLPDSTRTDKTADLSVASVLRTADQWQLIQSDLNSLTLDTCRLRIEGSDWSEVQPVIFLQDQLVRLGHPVEIEMEFTVEAQPGDYLNRDMYLIIEQPDQYRISINDRILDQRELGWWRDIAFRKLDITSYLRAGHNRIVLARHFANSAETYAAVARAQVFESESNKLFYDTEIESIYLLGNFHVHSDTGYILSDDGEIYTDGHFRLQEPVHTVQSGDLTTQGLNFYAGNVQLLQQLIVPELDSGQQLWMRFERPDAVLSRLWLNGQEVHTFMWAPYAIEITDYIRTGDNELMIELMSSCRNLLGPHHHVRGELTMVGPDSFKDKPSWTDGDHPEEHIYTDRYCLTPFGLKGHVEVILYT
ncbi:glycosyl hydrolase [Paenibacillus shenyangensis]|uniref:glycosyl hydrolase n=1 Tax=Paenibacillus sp. A9 TaxID=1284352 RepID=UPI00035C0D29|nr:glycosyl hydrolase [Paenibacillus sp. A9]